MAPKSARNPAMNLRYCLDWSSFWFLRASKRIQGFYYCLQKQTSKKAKKQKRSKISCSMSHILNLLIWKASYYFLVNLSLRFCFVCKQHTKVKSVSLTKLLHFKEVLKVWMYSRALVRSSKFVALALTLNYWRSRSRSRSQFFKLMSARSRSWPMSAAHFLRSFEEIKAMQFSKNYYHRM